MNNKIKKPLKRCIFYLLLDNNGKYSDEFFKTKQEAIQNAITNQSADKYYIIEVQNLYYYSVIDVINNEKKEITKHEV